MSEATLISGNRRSVDRDWPMPRRLAWFALGLAACTIALMALGSATRVMNAGLSCPDWPLCYGTLLPHNQMNLQVFLEWFHRLVASVIGFGTIVMTGAAYFYRSRLPRWTPAAMTLALLLVMFQGLLGGLTVTQLLRFDIVTAHLGTGLAFFSTLLTIGLCLLDFQPSGTTGSLRWFGLTAAIAVYAQSLLGGLVASQWALHQCFGQTQLCGVLNTHLIGVVPATLTTVAVLVWLARYRAALDPGLKRLGWLVAGLLLTQIGLGFATFRLHLQVEPLTVAHQMIGAALLGSLIATTVLAWKSHVPKFPVESANASVGCNAV
jgi:heme a synthase